MSEFVPTEKHMKHVLILLFQLKKTPTEAQEQLEQAYGKLALKKEICEFWFKRFENNDFSLEETSDYAQLKSSLEIKKETDEN